LAPNLLQLSAARKSKIVNAISPQLLNPETFHERKKRRKIQADELCLPFHFVKFMPRMVPFAGVPNLPGALNEQLFHYILKGVVKGNP
jgi:hypothetical protein